MIAPAETQTNPAPRDRVLLVCGHVPGWSGFPSYWRVSAPGRGVQESCVGDRWLQFLAFWRCVADAIRLWDHDGRRGPVFSDLTREEQRWMVEVTAYTITDKQIHEMRSSLPQVGFSNDELELWCDTSLALGLYGSAERRAAARVRCATAWNARERGIR